MNNKKFTKDLFDKINKEKISQTPKYIFITKNILVWFFLFFSIFIGALSLSISLDYLFNADWDLFRRIWFLKIFLIFIPVFWLLFLIISSVLSYYNYRYTDKWYKLSFIKVLFLNIFSSLILAFILYFTWINNYIELKIENIVPKYRTILVEDKINRMIKVWQNEEKWLLIWTILDYNDTELKLNDFNNKEWIITLNRNIDIKSRVKIENWERIKIIWEKIDWNNFDALEIRPFVWKGR